MPQLVRGTTNLLGGCQKQLVAGPTKLRIASSAALPPALRHSRERRLRQDRRIFAGSRRRYSQRGRATALAAAPDWALVQSPSIGGAWRPNFLLCGLCDPRAVSARPPPGSSRAPRRLGHAQLARQQLHRTPRRKPQHDGALARHAPALARRRGPVPGGCSPGAVDAQPVVRVDGLHPPTLTTGSSTAAAPFCPFSGGSSAGPSRSPFGQSDVQGKRGQLRAPGRRPAAQPSRQDQHFAPVDLRLSLGPLASSVAMF